MIRDRRGGAEGGIEWGSTRMYGVQAGGRLPGTPLYVAVEEGGEVIWDQEDCLSAATAAARCGWRVAARQGDRRLKPATAPDLLERWCTSRTAFVLSALFLVFSTWTSDRTQHCSSSTSCSPGHQFTWDEKFCQIFKLIRAEMEGNQCTMPPKHSISKRKT